MKASSRACWLSRRDTRLRNIKLWQQGRIGSELTLKWTEEGAVMNKTKQIQLFKVKKQSKADIIKSSNFHSDSFQNAIRPVLILAQVFALMPVQGITAKSAKNLNFSWTCARTVYSLFIIICFGICSGFTIAFVCRVTFNFDSVETLIFYTSIFLIAIAFFDLARKWPALLLQWEEVESTLPSVRTATTKKCTLASRIKIITLVATMCSVAEHTLSVLAIVYFVKNCPAMPGRPLASFLYMNFHDFFYFVEFNMPAGFIGKVLNLLSTFAWNFNDVFVMSVSVALSSRFRQLNDYMQHAIKWPTQESFWIRNRVNYRNLCKLCAAVDDAISTITLLCFSNNLYFICGKILKSVRKKPSLTHSLYFWYSLIYLLARTFILSLFAAEINDESKRPLMIFRRIKRESWCPELKRFSEEVTTDVVALSGMKFFQITRNVVLSVAGTIVTYELVLLQFNKEEGTHSCVKS